MEKLLFKNNQTKFETFRIFVGGSALLDFK